MKKLLLLLMGLSWGCQQSVPEHEVFVTDSIYVKDITMWQIGRIKGLQKSDGWVSLVGLFWLEEGSKTFGAAGQLKPETANIAPQLGTFRRQADSIWFESAKGVPVMMEGKAIKEALLYPPLEDDPAILRCGSLSWHIIARDKEYAVRVRDSLSANFAQFTPPTYYPANAAWKVVAQFQPSTPPDTLLIDNITGQKTPTPSPGQLVFSIKGETYSLKVLEGTESTYFVLFGDATNGEESYGAGRYMYIPHPDKTGKTVIDFNKAYSPPCAFTKYATCPLPMRSNVLKIKIEAGEKAPH